MVNAYFEKKLQEIREDDMQLAAYKAVNNTVVIAGPGSGKTTVLTLKVMQLLAEVIYPPRGLACLTYSTEAVREFKSRLVKLGLEKRKNVFLGTVHSFCLSEIITPFAALYPQYKIPLPIRIISEAEKNRLFDSQNYEGSPKLIDVDKERTRNIKGISRVAIESYDIALKAAISFEELLIQNGYLDFISMVKKSVELIKNEPYVRKALEAKYPWIIVDEYQDLGKPLHELILTLLNLTRIKVFAVGDADQSIYDFQGAAPDYLVELSQRQDVSCIHLKNNYFLLKRTIFQTLTASKVCTDNLSEWLCYLDKEVGIVSAFTASERYPDEIDNFNKLLETARSHDTQLTIKFLTRLGIPENQVVLTTRHSSKGLEFDVVILPGMEKDSFPSYYDNTPRKLAEARRLCFVSVSRARKACILIRSKNLQNKYGRWFSKEPSPFWVALQEFQDSRSN